MFMYEGAACPYCGKALTESDSLAVCPDCGTPHHRDCYKEHGRCANAERHAEGYEWTPPQAPQTQRAVVCARCGRENDAAGRFCNYCGYEFGSDPVPLQPGDGNLPRNMLFFRNGQGEPEPLRSDELIDDISVHDWATYIGPSAPYYLFNFKMQKDTGRKTSFTLSAMLFPTLYFLYRKVWVFAGVSFALNSLLSVPSVLLVLLRLGMAVPVSAELVTSFANVCSAALMAVNLFWALFAVYIYRTSAAKHIRALRAAAGEDGYQAALQKNAGPSLLAVQLVFAALACLSVIAYFFL